MKAIRLRTEYLIDPLGVDFKRPRLMWNCEGGERQTAYRIVTDKWDSGRVESGSMHADYPMELASRERVNWKIALWDEKGEQGEWSESFFEIGSRETMFRAERNAIQWIILRKNSRSGISPGPDCI